MNSIYTNDVARKCRQNLCTFPIALRNALFAFVLTGTASAMAAPPDPAQPIVKNAWPLKYKRHNFDAYWYNTLKCRIIYNDFNFTLDDENKPSKPPPSTDYKKLFAAGYGPVRNFPSPADVRWTSLDGTAHVASVDIGEIFKDEVVRHHVPQDDVANIYPQFGPEPGVILEVNDRTISVYMRAMVATKSLREPGNKNSDYRDDLILAWNHTY